MAILITGGYGLVGSWITRLLALEGNDVIIYDIQSREFDYLEEVKDRIIYVRGDILDYPRLVDTFRRYEGRIEGVIHTIAIVAGPHFWANPHRNVSINVVGTLNILEASRVFGIKRLVNISSGAVYGEAKRTPVPSEDEAGLEPSDLYGASKAGAELIGFQYETHYGLDFRCVRLYFVYGPGKKPSVINPLFKTVFGSLEGFEKLSLDTGRDQALDFTYVEDAAYGVILAYKAEEPKYKVFNIATGKPYKLSEVAAITQKYAEVKSEIEFGPGLFFIRRPSIDISRAKTILGYTPRWTIEEGIKEYAEWLRNNP